MIRTTDTSILNSDKDSSTNGKKCCKVTAKYHVAAPGCADDDAAVAALPELWEPSRQSGPILAKFLKENELAHNNIFRDIADRAKTTNDSVNSKIRALAEALLAYIQHNNNQIDYIITKYNRGDVALNKELRDQALKEIYQLHSQRVDKMAHFKREASALEKERADAIRILLHDQYQRLISVGHRSPKELLHDFDERVYQFNQQLLSNIRAHTDLEAQLRVQLDERVGRARSVVNQLCLGGSMRNREQSALPWSSEERTDIQRSASAVIENKRKSTMSYFTLSGGKGIDAIFTLLLKSYQAAVVQVFTGFSNHLKELENDVLTHNYFDVLNRRSNKTLEFQQMIDNTVRYLFNNVYEQNLVSTELLDVTNTDVFVLQKSFSSLNKCLKNTFHILHDASHLWDNHILRQAMAQKLTIAAVEDLLTRNDAIELTDEVTFNVALEYLQGSSNVLMLRQSYENIMEKLKHIAETYRLHSVAEIGCLEEFMKLPTLLASVLLSEFECFLVEHPKLNPSSSGTDIKFEFSSRGTASDNSPLPHAISQTKLQERALRIWRNGFLESMENKVSMFSEQLQQQARLWIDERAKALHVRYSLKMVSHSVRAERIETAFETRLSELRYHEARLESHIDALKEVQDSLLDESDFSSLDDPKLYPLTQWIQSIKANMETLNQGQESLNSEVKRLKISSYISRLSKHQRLFEDSLTAAVEKHKMTLKYSFQNARISNTRFMSHIKLFYEGGGYTTEEAKRAYNSLVNEDTKLETCIKLVMDTLNRRMQMLLSKANQMIQPLLLKCQETLRPVTSKVSKKSSLAKKK